MNNITLAHVGGELVLLGGIAFYFHRKTAALQDVLTKMQSEQEDLQETIEEMKEVIQQLNAAVMQLRHTQMPKAMPVHVPKRDFTPVKKPKKKPPRRVEPITDSEDSGLNNSELDRELADEYIQLQQDRNNVREDRDDCEGEVCELIT